MTVEASMRAFIRQTRTAPVARHGWATGQAAPAAAANLEFGPFRVSATERLLTRNGIPVSIGGRAFDLLLTLLDRAGQVVGARQLHSFVWPDVVVEEANLRVCVATLRKALGEHNGEARYIVNVAGRGYVFVAPVNRVAPEEALPNAGVGGFRAAPNLGHPPQLLISRTETIDVLSRLLASDRFARLFETGNGAPPDVARTLLTLLHEACGLDAACFVLHAQQPARSDGSGANPTLTERPLHAANRDVALGAYLAESPLLIVLGRCQHLTATVKSLFESLFRAPSVHFLTTSWEAGSAGLEGTPWAAPPGADQADATPMIDALDQIGIAALPYRQWRAEFTRQIGNGSRSLEELQKENERLRQAISDLTLEKLILKEASLGSKPGEAGIARLP